MQQDKYERAMCILKEQIDKEMECAKVTYDLLR